jgi:hypothetical protein
MEYAVLVRSADVLTDSEVSDANWPCCYVAAESTDTEGARLPVEEFRDRTAARREEPA